jgi:hypothetical protein
LRNAEKLRHGPSQAENALYAGEGAATEGLARAARAIRELARSTRPSAPWPTTSRPRPPWPRTRPARCPPTPAASTPTPNGWRQIEERLALFARLRRKHGATLTEIIARRESIAAELALVAGAEESATELEAARERPPRRSRAPPGR